jgi:hypothetical protein
MFTWTKNSGKRRQEWEKACVKSGLWFHKLQTPMKMRFANKVIMFEEALKFKKTIICVMGSSKQWHYNRGFLRLRYGQLQKHSVVF